MPAPPVLAAVVVLKGLLVTSRGGVEVGRQRYEDDGRTLRSEITFLGHTFNVTLERVPRRAVVKEEATTVTREIPAGTIALENGDWQAYALAADQFPEARVPVAVKVLIPGQGAVVNGTIRVTRRPDRTRHVEVAIAPLTVEVDVGADGAVIRAAIPLQNLEARAEAQPADTPPKPRPPSEAAAPRQPPAGVVEEPLEIARAGVRLRGVLWRPADAKGKLPLALIVAGSGPTDRDGNNTMGMRTDCYRMLAEALAKAGVATIRYDKRGVGASDKVPEASVRIEDFVDDAGALLAHARRDGRFSKLTIIGHSEGGLIGLLLASRTPPDALVLLATAGRPLWQVIHAQAVLQGESTEKMDVILAALREGKPVPAYPPELAALFRPSVEKFLRSEIAIDPVALLAKLKLPVSIVQGQTDIQVTVADARLLATARKDARLVLLPNVNHVLKQESAASPRQPSYGDPSRPLGPGLVDAVRAALAR